MSCNGCINGTEAVSNDSNAENRASSKIWECSKPLKGALTWRCRWHFVEQSKPNNRRSFTFAPSIFVVIFKCYLKTFLLKQKKMFLNLTLLVARFNFPITLKTCIRRKNGFENSNYTIESELAFEILKRYTILTYYRTKTKLKC